MARQPCWGLPTGDRGQGTACGKRAVPWRNSQGIAGCPARLPQGPQLSPEAARGWDSPDSGLGAGVQGALCAAGPVTVEPRSLGAWEGRSGGKWTFVGLWG